MVEHFDLYGAYLFGTDGIAIRRAQIICNDGTIDCQKPNLGTAGLSLLWPIDGLGKMMLQTTCLPEREQPYTLNVEIARAKLMQIVVKREEWSIFDNNTALADDCKQAQELFIKALQHVEEPATAAKYADESLKKAVECSEKLANHQSHLLFETRRGSHGFGRGCFGCKIDPEKMNNADYFKHFTQSFGLAVIPINWANIEAVRGNYDFSTIDNCIKYLSDKKLAIGAGPLLRFTPENLPKWLLKAAPEFGKIREYAYKFVSEIVARYTNSIRSWRVISGLNAFNHFGFNFEQVLEMTRAANMAVKAGSDRAIKIIELSNPWGEYYATSPTTIPPIVYLDMTLQSGITFDAIGLQMQFGKNEDGLHVRDMMQISAVLDTFAPLAKPVSITEVEVPCQNGPDAYDGQVAGIWHEQWNQTGQAEWLEQFYKIALSRPFVDSVTYSHLADTASSVIAGSGLLTEDLKPKAAFLALKKLETLIFSR